MKAYASPTSHHLRVTLDSDSLELEGSEFFKTVILNSAGNFTLRCPVEMDEASDAQAVTRHNTG